MQARNGIRQLWAAAMLGAIAVTPVTAATMVKFTVPGATRTWGVSTNTNGDITAGWTDAGANGINASCQTAGYLWSAQKVPAGFIRTP